ncbi:acetate CoA-transferase subunit alpha [Sporomusa malonica]|uniref:Acetate CoA/acetoacetate CoA-transferase alpha subunit n=1 Tax=Sporomusa malonica TaxID=112901 RepID=A0A1W2BEE1_9FIRM|nr:acetate CoA-transferase subunit alpha [Sporomusa malonica]SMC70748.1 acetate CoA/acetoacetate CoA-transferase alpha subunit [Sporomusa malonica]
MTNKQASIQQVTEYLKDGMTIMVGGFLAVGTPEGLIKALIDQKVQNLTLIANDTGFPDKGVGPLVVNRQIKKVIASHIGTNPETGKQMIAAEMAVELVPQGTLAERVRCGGAGLGGVLTPTGVGTVVEEGKQKLCVDGVDYLLEKPLRADIALIKAKKADKAGNLVYDKSARNFNPLMAMAADLVIVEVDELVEVGEINPDDVMTPGVVVNKIVYLGGC